MRIIGRLADPRMQITVFENDGRFPVQFERGGLTQIYRFRKGEGLGNFGQVTRLVDADFRGAVLQQFEEMQRIHSGLVASIEPTSGDHDDLPTIV